MKRLTKSQILQLHHELIERFGGVHGLQDEGLLSSAINAPFQTFSGNDLYPSILEKAAKLTYYLVKNHPFIDGNKRIGALSLTLFLKLNNVNLHYSHQELIEIILQLASGELSSSELFQWISAHVE